MLHLQDIAEPLKFTSQVIRIRKITNKTKQRERKNLAYLIQTI